MFLSKIFLFVFYGVVGSIVGFAVAWLLLTAIDAVLGQDAISESTALWIALLGSIGCGLAMGGGSLSAARPNTNSKASNENQTEHSDGASQ